MPHNRFPAIVTSDGFLDPHTVGNVELHETYGSPSITGHMVVQLRSDLERGIARDLHTRNALDIHGKSGHSRVLLNVEGNADEDVLFERDRVIVPIRLSSLRAVEIRRNGVRDELLSVLADVVREKRREVHIGRLAMAIPEQALSREEVLGAIQRNRLRLTPGTNPEQLIADDGSITIPLEDLEYLFCEEIFDEVAMRRVLCFGKHGMEGLQTPKKGLPDKLRGRQGFVGGIRISIGPYIAIIDRQMTDPNVEHLAARILDGVRTTGLHAVRQVEMFNRSVDPVSTQNLRIRIRVFHATKEIQDTWSRVGSARTSENGVTFSDATELRTRPEVLLRPLREIAPTKADDGPFGYLVGSQRSLEIPWLQHPVFQAAHLQKVNAKFAASDAKYCVMGDEVPHFLRPLAGALRFVGGEQTEGRVCATWGFPDPATMKQMLDEGTGVFVAHDLRMRHDAFEDHPHLDRDGRIRTGIHQGKDPHNDIYFDEQHYNAFRGLQKAGAKFHLARHPCPDAFHVGKTMLSEVLEWHPRGMWVRPDERERLEAIDTVVAMYGSHVMGMEGLLEEQITRFSFRMKKRFGAQIAYIHGKGPGVMYIADDVADRLPELAEHSEEFRGHIREGIFRIGVGIDAERFGQLPNFHPPAQIDFKSKDRLTRQKHMNDRATFNIFNIGGAGTLEEIAVTLCSQKLFKNIPAPLILVDPVGLGVDGTHLWATFAELVTDLAARKNISLKQAENGCVHIQLLQSYAPNFLHIVSSYDEAADIIEGFADDPVAYYLQKGMPREDIIVAFTESAHTFRETGFPMPSWLHLPDIMQDTRWPREN